MCGPRVICLQNCWKTPNVATPGCSCHSNRHLQKSFSLLLSQILRRCWGHVCLRSGVWSSLPPSFFFEGVLWRASKIPCGYSQDTISVCLLHCCPSSFPSSFLLFSLLLLLPLFFFFPLFLLFSSILCFQYTPNYPRFSNTNPSMCTYLNNL